MHLWSVYDVSRLNQNPTFQRGKDIVIITGQVGNDPVVVDKVTLSRSLK